MEGAPAQYAPDVLGAECIRVNECSAGRFIHGWDMQPTFLSDQDLLELGFEDLSQAADALDAHQHSELKHDGSFLVQAKHLSEQAPYRNDSDIHQGHHRSASLPRDVRHGSDMHGQQSLTVHDGRPSNDTIRGVEDSMRISCATAAAVHGALAEGVAFDLPNVGNINSSVLRSTVVQHSTAIISATPSEQMAIAASALENVTSDSYINVGGTTKRWVYQDNELNTNTKKRMKLVSDFLCVSVITFSMFWITCRADCIYSRLKMLAHQTTAAVDQQQISHHQHRQKSLMSKYDPASIEVSLSTSAVEDGRHTFG